MWNVWCQAGDRPPPTLWCSLSGCIGDRLARAATRQGGRCAYRAGHYRRRSADALTHSDFPALGCQGAIGGTHAVSARDTPAPGFLSSRGLGHPAPSYGRRRDNLICLRYGGQRS